MINIIIIFRYNDKLVRWDEGAEDDDSWTRRHLVTIFKVSFLKS